MRDATFDILRDLEGGLLQNDMEYFTARLRQAEEAGFDLNFPFFLRKQTILHRACFCERGRMVSLLLAYPGINVNALTDDGLTPLAMACMFGARCSLEFLLRDPRTDLSLADLSGRTALWWAVAGQHISCLKRLLAHRAFPARCLHVIVLDENRGRRLTPLGLAKIWGFRYDRHLFHTLEAHHADPLLHGHRLRVELGEPQARACEIFGLIVFLCDGLLALPPAASFSRDHVLRYFTLLQHLPLELQMMVSRRGLCLTGHNFPTSDTEPVFRSLADFYHRQDLIRSS